MLGALKSFALGVIGGVITLLLFSFLASLYHESKTARYVFELGLKAVLFVSCSAFVWKLLRGLV